MNQNKQKSTVAIRRSSGYETYIKITGNIEIEAWRSFMGGSDRYGARKTTKSARNFSNRVVTLSGLSTFKRLKKEYKRQQCKTVK